MEYDIIFTGHYEGQVYTLESNENEYRSLMTLLKDKICPDEFGQCGGMGRCGTCLVKISGVQNDSFHESFRNEHATLKKIGVTEADVRLSCQVLVNADLKNAIVELVDDY